MWIRVHNDATQRLYNSDIMDEPVEVNDSGTAQVSDDVGAALCDHYDTIEPKDTE